MVKLVGAPLHSLREQMIKKLRGSGLHKQADIKRFGFKALTIDHVAKQYPKLKPARGGIFIPYFDLSGKPIDFYRIRYLEDSRGFEKLFTGKSFQKYSQPEGSKNHLYFPRVGVDWKKVAADPNIPIVITEGEFKAACACKHGIPTIGLGGVYNWQKEKQLIPDFKDSKIKWKGRIVRVAYDSDESVNYQVAQARNALARALLADLGCQPQLIHIPLPETSNREKDGIDDYIIHEGINKFKKLLEDAEYFSATEELHKLNEEVVYVKYPGEIFVLKDNERMRWQDFVNATYANRIYLERVETQIGTKVTPKNAAKEWIKWPFRSEVKRLTYMPGKDQIINGELNLWPGWGVDSQFIRPGNVSLWKQLLDHLFQEAEPAHRKWFEQWLAYPLQHPGAKLLTAAVVWGGPQGTGKTLIGHTMARLYGKKNFSEIKQGELESQFNEWAANKQFIIGDEIATGSHKQMIANHMKTMITQQTMTINAKFLRRMVLPDCANYYFTSNSSAAIFIEDRDRRYFIHEVSAQPKPQTYYAEYDRWYKSDEGAGALLYHLQNLDLTGFSLIGPAPETAAKTNLKAEGLSAVKAWARRLRDEPETTKVYEGRLVPRSLFRYEELEGMFKSVQTRSNVADTGLNEALRDAGFRKYRDRETGYSKQQVAVREDGWGSHVFWMIMPKEEAVNVNLRSPKQVRSQFLKERRAWPEAPDLFRPVHRTMLYQGGSTTRTES